MKKNIKITLATVTLLASAALAPMAMPVHAADVQNTTTAATANNAKATTAVATTATNTTQTAATDANTQTVSMAITQTGTDKPSEAGTFLGKTAKLVMKDGKIDQVVLHVNGMNTPMGMGQDMSKVITKLTINGVAGKQANIKDDGSELDFVFPATAYKEGKGTLEVELHVMNRAMSEKADITFGKVETKTEEPAAKTDTTKQENTNTEVAAKVDKKTKTVKKATKKAKAKKRTLKHNAYAYKKNGKRANKKVLKKGKKVNTYGKAIKLHGKAFYRISKNTYVKKANF
ncbi:SLAP domain-containing protein [Lactobacillus xujianguonis]|uniref:SLAP domain-containing protein n=1 Tax=Lactobacillus xujianguonis TaxID=2495899 RepID=UPI000FD7BE34|nr:SLAP domain-containing protein [Lactobacillus xujianguonis]RVU72070.1 hypothetical protein EJK20_11015 [Lactobacillus xujianguonis]